ncbi:thiamine pyrophosphate-binding protein [Litoribrevibacter albus]|uniref:Acetolactate synthase n=1 Tax=Litoribrevibacter albus TaxID=1473156 RepID=A0AA37W4Z3_9GAMM|nr:thiamine pyrophosphate-binding protein [Litoribrevibacter albus]GLQ30145.1 acetolactate synthase [Litoribrevibacter albus]
MKKTGAWLARYAMEQIGIRHTFGIPGVHNTELYDELNKSDQIEPILVCHEGGGAFMADAVSRVSDSIGALVIVPAAGVAYAAAGIGEAFLDGIPMLVICGGVRTDLEYGNQLHQMDQHSFIGAFCKKTYLIEDHKDILPTFYDAYEVATRGEPGPVFIEIPVNVQLFSGDVDSIFPYESKKVVPAVDDQALEQAISLIEASERPCIFAGWGAVNASDELIELAEMLNAPIATTLQGLSVVPHDHPLHAGFSFGPASVPAAQRAFEQCDCLIAIGTKFSEIATGSFGVNPPDKLIHIDISPESIGVNFQPSVALVADAQDALSKMTKLIRRKSISDVAGLIHNQKQGYLKEWLAHDSQGKVNPAAFFQDLRQQLPREAITVVDDGNHTYLAAELMPIYGPKRFISPTDFNCMGYSVPAAIGAKLSHPDQDVIAIVGDGCFAMTCMEISTATALGLGVVYFVFNDGELSQIAQAQEIPYNRKPCTSLNRINFEGVALAVGAEYVCLEDHHVMNSAIARALTSARSGKPVIVDVKVDYSKKTAFTQGAVKTNFKRFDFKTKLRIGSRALKRKITG